jgi:RNA polymerase sigma-70 factor (ECF subfamily)
VAGLPGKQEERQLLIQHRNGEAGAFSEFVARYRAPVYAYLVRCSVDAGARDDLFQEIFLKIHSAARSYQADRPLHPWVFTIVANTVRSHFRKMRVREIVFPEHLEVELAGEAPDGQQLLEAKEVADWLDRALQALPRGHREALLLFCVENLSQQEIAEALDLPLNTVKTYVRRGRMALAQALVRRNREKSS